METLFWQRKTNTWIDKQDPLRIHYMANKQKWGRVAINTVSCAKKGSKKIAAHHRASLFFLWTIKNAKKSNEFPRVIQLIDSIGQNIITTCPSHTDTLLSWIAGLEYRFIHHSSLYSTSKMTGLHLLSWFCPELTLWMISRHWILCVPTS